MFTLVNKRNDLSGVVDIELDLLLEGVYRRYGYDFRHYSRASLQRRVQALMQEETVASVSALQGRVLHDPVWADLLVRKIAVGYSEMFRDPEVYRQLLDDVFPLLRSLPFVRLWHAGCASGEEVYSLAILLSEAGLYGRSRIYATDMVEGMVEQARLGVFSLGRMRQYTANYHAAGGVKEFSRYFTAHYHKVRFSRELLRNVTFAQHNLASDAVFNHFNLVLCRNVLIYFDEELVARAHGLIYDSLERGGLLVLGKDENLRLSPFAGRFEPLGGRLPIYRKIV